VYVIITSCKRCGHRGISPASIVDNYDDDDDDDDGTYGQVTMKAIITDSKQHIMSLGLV